MLITDIFRACVYILDVLIKCYLYKQIFILIIDDILFFRSLMISQLASTLHNEFVKVHIS